MSLTATDVVKIISFFLPLLVAVVAKAHAPSWVKGSLHTLFAAVTGALGVLVSAGGDYDWRAFVSAIITALVTSAAAYIALWKHVGVPQIAAKTSGFGLGPEQVEVLVDKGVVEMEALAQRVVQIINSGQHTTVTGTTPAPVVVEKHEEDLK
jgi:hypothetical protein